MSLISDGPPEISMKMKPDQEKNECDWVLTLLLIDLVVGLSIKQCLLIDFVI